MGDQAGRRGAETPFFGPYGVLRDQAWEGLSPGRGTSYFL